MLGKYNSIHKDQVNGQAVLILMHIKQTQENDKTQSYCFSVTLIFVFSFFFFLFYGLTATSLTKITRPFFLGWGKGEGFEPMLIN